MAAPSILVRIVGDSKGLEAAFARSAAATQGFASKTQAAGAKMTGIGRKMSMGLTLPLVGIGAAAFKMGQDFDKALAPMDALVKSNRGQMDVLKSGIMDVSKQTGKSANEMAEAMYFITSSGIPAAQATDVLRSSAMAAAAGLGETKTVADAVTSAINAYGAENITAAEATDILVAAIDQGKAEPEEFARVLGNLMAPAEMLGVEFEEVAAGMASMSLQGVEAGTASASLRAMLMTFVKPSKQAKDALESVGLSTDSMRKAIAEKGLLPAFDMLKKKFGDNVEGLGKIFMRQDAFTALQILTGKAMGKNVKIFEALANATGSTAKAFEVASQKSSFKWNQAMNSMRLALIQLGGFLAPILTTIALKVASMVQTVTDWFKKLSPEGQKLVKTIGAVAIAAGPVLMILGSLVGAILPIAAAVGAIVSPIGLLIGAFAALAVVAVAPDTAVSLLEKLGVSSQTAATAVGILQTAFRALSVAFGVLKTVASAIFSTLNSDLGRFVATSALMVASGLKLVAMAIAVKNAFMMMRVAISLMGTGAALVNPISAAVVVLGIAVGGLITLFQRNAQHAREMADAWVRAAGDADKLKAAIDNLRSGALDIRSANQEVRTSQRAVNEERKQYNKLLDESGPKNTRTAAETKALVTAFEELETAKIAHQRADLALIKAQEKQRENMVAFRTENNASIQGIYEVSRGYDNWSYGIDKTLKGLGLQQQVTKKSAESAKDFTQKALEAARGQDKLADSMMKKGAPAAAEAARTTAKYERAVAQWSKEHKRVPKEVRMIAIAKMVGGVEFSRNLKTLILSTKKAKPGMEKELGDAGKAGGKKAAAEVGKAKGPVGDKAAQVGSGAGNRMKTSMVGGLDGLGAALAAKAQAEIDKAGIAAAVKAAGRGENEGSGEWEFTRHVVAEPMVYGLVDMKSRNLAGRLTKNMKDETTKGVNESTPEAVAAATAAAKKVTDALLMGYLTGTASLPDNLSAKMTAAIDKAKAAVEAGKSKFQNAWSRLAEDALKAFDAKTQAGLDTLQRRLQAKLDQIDRQLSKALEKVEKKREAKTPAEKALENIDKAEDLRSRTQALKDAEQQLRDAQAGKGFEATEGETPEQAAERVANQQKAIEDAKEAVRQANLANTKAALAAQAEIERKAADAEAKRAADWQTKQAEKKKKEAEKDTAEKQKENQAKRDLDKRHLEDWLAKQQEFLEKHPEQWRKVHARVMARFKEEFGPNFKFAGKNLGTAFVTGLKESFADMDSTARELARLIAKYLKSNSPPEAGPLSDIDKWGDKLIIDGFIGNIDLGGVEKAMHPVGQALVKGLINGVGGVEKSLAFEIDWETGEIKNKPKTSGTGSSGSSGSSGSKSSSSSGDLPGDDEDKTDPMAGVAAKFDPDLMGIATNAAAALNKSEEFGEALRSGNIKTDARLLDLLSQAGIRIWGPAASGYPRFTGILNEMRPEPVGLGLSGREAAMKYNLTYPPVPMALGGIVKKPTFAMLGEAGPEAVVPLGRQMRGPQVGRRLGGVDIPGRGGRDVTVTFNGPVYGGTPEQLARVLTPAIADELRRSQSRGNGSITRTR